MVDVIISGKKVSVTDSMRTYLEEKLARLTYIEKATQISIEISQSMSHKGKSTDFAVRILCHFPGAPIRVKKEGADIYVLIDLMMEPLQGMITRHVRSSQELDHIEVQKYEVVDDTTKEINPEYVMTYEPKVRRKYITDLSPMSVSDAIEKMELLSQNTYLFRNIQDNKFSVVYKENGEYILLVPGE